MGIDNRLRGPLIRLGALDALIDEQQLYLARLLARRAELRAEVRAFGAPVGKLRDAA